MQTLADLPLNKILSMPMADYLAIDAISASGLVMMKKSPLHFAYSDNKDTPSRTRGTAAHAAILEPDRFKTDYVAFDGDRRTKEYREFKANNIGKEVVTAAEMNAYNAMALSVRSHPVASKYLSRGVPEATIKWLQDGIACKARIDWYQTFTAIVELKTTSQPETDKFIKQSYNLGYHLKYAWYHDAIKQVTGEKLPVIVITVESEYPFDCVCYSVPDYMLEIGRNECTVQLAQYRECLLSGNWPGISSQLETLEFPKWAYREDDDVELDIGGEHVAL